MTIKMEWLRNSRNAYPTRITNIGVLIEFHEILSLVNLIPFSFKFAKTNPTGEQRYNLVTMLPFTILWSVLKPNRVAIKNNSFSF